MRNFLVTNLKPVLVELGKIHVPYSKKRLKNADSKLVLSQLKPGDVLLTRTSGELTNWFIPGKYKHAAIYFGDEHVVEATGVGVHGTHLNDFIMSKDYVAVFRNKFCTEEQSEEAANWAWMQRGRPYDYFFKSDNESFYCFELTYAAYNEVLKEKNPWTLRKTFGEPTVVAEDFLRAKTKWGEVLCL